MLSISCNTFDKVEEHKKAIQFENAKLYEAANSIHDEILKNDPKFRPSLINRGANKAALGNYNGAIDDYKRLLQFDSDNVLALSNIGNNYQNLEKLDSAIYFYSKALTFSKEEDLIKVNFEDSYDEDHDYYVNKSEILFGRGLCFFNLKQYKNAILDFNSITKNEEEFIVRDAYFYLGKSHIGLNDTLTACSYFKKALTIGIPEGEDKEYISNVCK